MSIILKYPAGYILFCFLLGLAYATVLYYKTKDFTLSDSRSKYIPYILAFLRFTSVSILAFLLLSPLVKSKKIEKIPPVIILAHDNSKSITLQLNPVDSTRYVNDLNNTLSELAKEYKIDYFSFDQEIKEIDTLDFTGSSSNLSNALDYINGLYFNQNVGAVIFASDGMYNEGINPSYTSFNFPIYSVGLGDTTQGTDLKVIDVKHNKIAYLGDNIQLNVNIQANHLAGTNFSTTLFQNNNLINTKNTSIKKDFDEIDISFQVEASKVGIQKFTIQVEEFKNEVTLKNNLHHFYIEVIDNRQKILLLANAPHPDIASIKQSISKNKNYDLKVFFAPSTPNKIEEYNLVILHQIPSNEFPQQQFISLLNSKKIPTWYIVGSASNINAFNKSQNVVKINKKGNSNEDIQALYNKNFTSFSVSDHTIEHLKKFYPVKAPFASYQLGAGAQALLTQKIGNVDIDYPLLAYQENTSTRTGVFIGDGLWRWKLSEYEYYKSSDVFFELMDKTINYLSLKGDKRKFRVYTNKSMYQEGENIIFRAELYNDNYELVSNNEVSLKIKNETGKEFPFTMSPINNGYGFETNSLKIGSYTYTAKTNYAGKTYKANGAFNVIEMHLEAMQTKANHKVLKQLANQTNGMYVEANNVSNIKDALLNENKVKPLLKERTKTQSIINLPGFFWLIFLLLATEWFARKWYGSY